VSALATSFIVLACVLAGAVLGMFLRSRLPGHQLSADAKDVVRLGTGLIGTIAALVLGLLIASAKNAFDTQSTQVQQLTSNIILLDRLLAAYGPEAADARKLLRGSIAALVERIWHSDASRSSTRTRFEASHESEEFVEKLQSLSPKNDAQRSLKDRAFETMTEVAKARLLLFVQSDSSIPTPFLVVLVFWLTIIFASFSLFAETNAVVVWSLFIFSVSAAGAIFLILELSQPFTGLMHISDEPLRTALAPLNA
jgi:hypothetical protein